MQNFILSLISIFSLNAFAAENAPVISARSPEVLASYEAAGEFVENLSGLKPQLQRMCKSLLDSQLKLHQTSDSWKMYSLYEMFNEQRLMTGTLQRVATVTEFSDSIPKYTAYRLTKVAFNSFTELRSGSIIIADKGTQCGPDPLSINKGAYFLKCGDYLIGSGMIRAADLQKYQCLNIRILTQ